MVLSLRRFVFYAAYGVVHLLHVFVCISPVWKVCCDGTQIEFVLAYVDVRQAFVDWDELLDGVPPTLVDEYRNPSCVFVVSGSAKDVAASCCPKFFFDFASFH